MNHNRQILYLPKSCDDSIQYFQDRLTQAGFQVIQTFDLQGTGRMETTCTCAHHGTAQCDCQMVILLVYGMENQPVSLMVHGHNGQTWLSLVELLGQADTHLEAEVCRILTSHQETPAAEEELS